MAAVWMQNTPQSKAVLQASSTLLLSSFLRPLTYPQWCIFKPFSTPPGLQDDPAAGSPSRGTRRASCPAVKPPSSHQWLHLPLPMSAFPRGYCGPLHLIPLASAALRWRQPSLSRVLSQGPCLSCAQLASLVCNSLLEPNIYACCTCSQLARNINIPMAEQQSLPKDPPVLLSPGSDTPALLGPPLASGTAGSAEERD